MKKVVLILATLLIGMISMGQTIKEKKSEISVLEVGDNNENYWYRSGVAVSNSDTLASYVIGTNENLDALKQAVRIKVTENSGTADVAIKFQGKNFWDEAYTDLLSTTYKGSGSDTTITFDGSTAKSYRFWKVLLDGNSGGTFTTTTKVEVKFYK